MIGRSLVIFQLDNNQNELHEVDSWASALSHKDQNIDQKIVAEAKNKNWIPEAIVDDAEVEAIVNATNCISPKEPGYHKWASDGVKVINLSGDPNLYNPAKVKADKRRQEEEKRKLAFQQLKEYIPELVVLRNAVSDRKVRLTLTIPVEIEVEYRCIESRYMSDMSVSVLGKDSRSCYSAQELIDRDVIRKLPEVSKIINCPHRLAYRSRCQQLADELGLYAVDIENKTCSAIHEQEKENQNVISV